MKVYKEKQFLVFDFEDRKNVKYNLATGETIGKLGKPVKGRFNRDLNEEEVPVVKKWNEKFGKVEVMAA